MFKSYFKVSVYKDRCDAPENDLLFEAYREDFNEAKHTYSVRVIKHFLKGYKKSACNGGEMLYDCAQYTVMEKSGFADHIIWLESDGAWIDDLHGIMLHFGNGLSFSFDTVEDAEKYLKKLERN